MKRYFFNAVKEDMLPIRLAILELSIRHLNDVLQTPEFSNRFFVEYGKTKELEGELSAFKHLPPGELYTRLFTSLVSGYPLFLEFYYSPLNTVGKVVNPPWIKINTKLFPRSVDDKAGLKRVASNLLHEYSHLMGASHDFRHTARRDNSVSYMLNRAFNAAFDQVYGHEENNVLTYKRPSFLAWVFSFFR